MWFNSAGRVAEAVFRGQACECTCGFGLGEARTFEMRQGLRRRCVVSFWSSG